VGLELRDQAPVAEPQHVLDRLPRRDGIDVFRQATSRCTRDRSGLREPGRRVQWMKDVFISHSSSDARFANEVCLLLESRGVSCWIAPRDLSPGAVFDEAILDAIDTTQATVLILSANANASPFVKNEVNRAFGKGKMILPFRMEDVLPTGSLEFYLARHQWADGFPPPVEERIGRLASAILALLGRTVPSPEPVPPARVSTPAPASPTSAGRVLTVTDNTGRATELHEYGIVYRPHGATDLTNAYPDGVIVERGAGSETIRWNTLVRLDVVGPSVASIQLTQGASVEAAALRRGTLVGRTRSGGDFALAMSALTAMAFADPAASIGVPGERAGMRVRVTTSWKGDWFPKGDDMLADARRDVETKLRAAGFVIAGSASDFDDQLEYEAEVEAAYSYGRGPVAEVGCRFSVLRRDGTVLGTDECSTIHRGTLFVPPLIGPYAASLLANDPAPLISLLEGSDPTSRSFAPRLIGQFDDVRAVEALLRAMSRADDNTASSCASALMTIAGRYGEGAAMEPLRRALRDRSWVRRVDAVERFQRGLGYRDAESRLGAVRLLGLIGLRAALESLAKLATSDEDAAIRAAAAAVVERASS